MRVLLVEDDPGMADVAAAYLRNAGCAVDVSADAAGALARAGVSPYDAVVLDLGVPDIDGLELCRRLRARHGSAMRIIMATARDSIEESGRGLDLGADDYLVKPCALAELVARLRALLRRPAEAVPATLVVDDLGLARDPPGAAGRAGDRAHHRGVCRPRVPDASCGCGAHAGADQRERVE